MDLECVLHRRRRSHRDKAFLLSNPSPQDAAQPTQPLRRHSVATVVALNPRRSLWRPMASVFEPLNDTPLAMERREISLDTPAELLSPLDPQTGTSAAPASTAEEEYDPCNDELDDALPPPPPALSLALRRDLSTEAKRIAAAVCKDDYMVMFMEKEQLKRRMRSRQITAHQYKTLTNAAAQKFQAGYDDVLEAARLSVGKDDDAQDGGRADSSLEDNEVSYGDGGDVLAGAGRPRAVSAAAAAAVEAARSSERAAAERKAAISSLLTRRRGHSISGAAPLSPLAAPGPGGYPLSPLAAPPEGTPEKDVGGAGPRWPVNARKQLLRAEKERRAEARGIAKRASLQAAFGAAAAAASGLGRYDREDGYFGLIGAAADDTVTDATAEAEAAAAAAAAGVALRRASVDRLVRSRRRLAKQKRWAELAGRIAEDGAAAEGCGGDAAGVAVGSGLGSGLDAGSRPAWLQPELPAFATGAAKTSADKAAADKADRKAVMRAARASKELKAARKDLLDK